MHTGVLFLLQCTRSSPAAPALTIMLSFPPAFPVSLRPVVVSVEHKGGKGSNGRKRRTRRERKSGGVRAPAAALLMLRKRMHEDRGMGERKQKNNWRILKQKMLDTKEGQRRPYWLRVLALG